MIRIQIHFQIQRKERWRVDVYSILEFVKHFQIPADILRSLIFFIRRRRQVRIL